MSVIECFKRLNAARVTRARIVEYQGRGRVLVRVSPWQRARAQAALGRDVVPVHLIVETKWDAPWRWFFGPAYQIRSVTP